MNCKQGDLAWIVRSLCGNEMKIVECIKLVGESPEFDNEFLPWHIGDGPCWLVRSHGSPIRCTNGRDYVEVPFPDACLHPICPNPPEEETTTNKELEAV